MKATDYMLAATISTKVVLSSAEGVVFKYASGRDLRIPPCWYFTGLQRRELRITKS